MGSRSERQLELDRARRAAETPAQREVRLAYQRAYYAANRERMKQQMAAYRADPVKRASKNAATNANYALTKDAVRDRQAVRRGMSRREWHLLNTYGITVEDYARMLAEQDGKCAGCGSTDPKGTLRNPDAFAVDHDHETNKVRGLLCGNCNRALGQVGDSVDVLMQLAAYLLQSQDVLGMSDLGQEV